MNIKIKGAREHNLKNIDASFGDGLTVVTGVSGSGKSSLVFDILYHEAHRRFLDVLLYGRSGQRLAPASVESISGLGPAIAVGQNLLNRNPGSILATASGLHPFFRLLYTNYGVRHCLNCGKSFNVRTEDEIIEQLASTSQKKSLEVLAPLVMGVAGSHRTLLSILSETFGKERLIVDGKTWDSKSLDPLKTHSIQINMGTVDHEVSLKEIRETIHEIFSLGTGSVQIKIGKDLKTLTTTLHCSECGSGLKELQPTHFNQSCPYCQGKGCQPCDNTGMHPQAASVHWKGMRLPELLEKSVSETFELFSSVQLPSTANRLRDEIQRRLDALEKVGLGYLSLNRSAPSLSRGEAQRVRLAISLSSRLEDMLHILDEPTIGQHPVDINRFLPAFRDLAGPVIYVEHDRTAAAVADHAIDIGPGAGRNGGNLIFSGAPEELWKTNSPTGRYFSLRDQVNTPVSRPVPDKYITVRQANAHNLKNIDVRIPIGRLTVITGVSGSGKSSLVEHVLVPTLNTKKPVACKGIEVPKIKPLMVDQSPIGKNPRSNPATYTKLSDIFRDLYSEATGMSKSSFSFNRPEGACETCKGIGASEVSMKYLPSIWITCTECNGKRFNQETLKAEIQIGEENLSIADLYAQPIQEVTGLIHKTPDLSISLRKKAHGILKSFEDIGLGYLELGQPSPTLSGGEAQRVKLTKYLGRNNLKEQLIILDEPSTGLHPQDLNGLLKVLDRLVKSGATIVVVEHNTDFMRAADWIIDLGPGAGPDGGEVIYQGPPEGLPENKSSLTGEALRLEKSIQPLKPVKNKKITTSHISIRGARANNLKGVDIDIPKRTLTVVTGVSGSGKSSLVNNVLETEARRRYLESLSMFERQGLREGAQAPVDSITGLGVTLTVAQHRAHLWSAIPQFTRRNSVGSMTELRFHIANILVSLGERKCIKCGTGMFREKQWICPECKMKLQLDKPEYFSGDHFASSCPGCSGIGTQQAPQPDKLIVDPDKPICNGAMYSPGYFPKTYLCKDQPIIPALGREYGFDPFTTPWKEMTKKARDAFLYGDNKTYTYTYISKSSGRIKGKEQVRKWPWPGFYASNFGISDWDVHGTYTRREPCDMCNGTGLKPEFLELKINGKNIFELSEMPLTGLEALIKKIPASVQERSPVEKSLEVCARRLRFLRKVGIGYLNLNRPAGTLSAGEAQRIQLAGLLGSGMTSLTILIDEPSRGMHPSELDALKEALLELRDNDNTVIIVEHDPIIIRAADYLIDMGPGAGAKGGKIVARGKITDIIKSKSITGDWLNKRHPGTPSAKKRSQGTKPSDWMVISGARENNLKNLKVNFPLNNLIGVCGVSGSGKSTLLIDTIARTLITKTHTSSLASEPVDPGEHDSIENTPENSMIVDQSKRDIGRPSVFLGLTGPLLKIYTDSDDAQALGINEKILTKGCSACGGRGRIKLDMGFLPAEFVECETCNATGYCPEAWDVRINGVALPDVSSMTLDEVSGIFKGNKKISETLKLVRQVGLGYLVWDQPSWTLSGGEAQRLKIIKEIRKKVKSPTLYILDEPTVGLHMADVARLTDVLNKLVDEGHTVIVVEHNPHMLAACDWLIELGPGGGPEGGKIIAQGPPEKVIKMKTPTASYLREIL